MKNTNIRKLSYHVRRHLFTTENLVIVVALIIGASFAWGSVNVLKRNYALQRDVDTKRQEFKLAELQTATLKYQQNYFKSDEYKELAVRERLGLGFPGEKVLILPPNSKEATESDMNDVNRRIAPAIQPTNTQLWVNFLFGSNSSDL